METMIYTFSGWGGIFLRSRTGRGLSVQSWKRETTRYLWINGDCVTYFTPETRVLGRQRTMGVPKTRLTEFLPEALWAEMIESVVSGLSGRHRRPQSRVWSSPNRGSVIGVVGE